MTLLLALGILFAGISASSVLAPHTANLKHDRSRSTIVGILADRPPPSERKFNSTAVERILADIAPRMKNPNLARVFSNAFPNCLDTTVEFDEDANDTFVITGDIDAMWLRDSTNQLLPYVQLIPEDAHLGAMVCGAIRRQARSVLIDRYANAFNKGPTGGAFPTDMRSTQPPVTYCDAGNVHEGKYEIDSLLAVIKLSYAYFNATNDSSCFNAEWLQAMGVIVDTITVQQSGTSEDFEHPAYRFQRTDKDATNTLSNQGLGTPGKRCGLSKSYFRPSDDSVMLPFNIPGNAMAVVELRHLAKLLDATKSAPALRDAATALAQQIDDAIHANAVITVPGLGPVFAYEVDGYGGHYLMDDANIPSLLSLPYLGYVAESDPIYQATRAFVWSDSNPYFFRGTAAEGIGGPHIGLGWIWPMSILMRALTSDDDAEIAWCLETLENTHADTYFMHESFWKDDAHRFTRSWFSWANSLFGQLILTLAKERPHLIF